MRLDNSSLVLSDVTELNSDNVIELRVEATATADSIEDVANIIADNQILYSQLQVLDGVVYLITDKDENENENDKDNDNENENGSNDSDLPATDGAKPSDEASVENGTVPGLEDDEGGQFPASSAESSDEETPAGSAEPPTTRPRPKMLKDPGSCGKEGAKKDGSRPYSCGESGCNKSFATCYSLKAHLKTHSDEKPFKCSEDSCDKSFKSSGDLIKHVRTHTGERPFKCPFEGCGRSFTTSNIRKVGIFSPRFGPRTIFPFSPHKSNLFDRLARYT